MAACREGGWARWNRSFYGNRGRNETAVLEGVGTSATSQNACSFEPTIFASLQPFIRVPTLPLSISIHHASLYTQTQATHSRTKQN